MLLTIEGETRNKHKKKNFASMRHLCACCLFLVWFTLCNRKLYWSWRKFVYKIFQVERVSSLSKEGLSALWDVMQDFRDKRTKSGELELQRRKQHVKWMQNHIKDNIKVIFNEHPGIKQMMPKLEYLVEKGAITPGYAADVALQEFSRSVSHDGDNRNRPGILSELNKI